MLISFWNPKSKVWKEIGRDKSTGLFPELTLKELVFLHHKYYSFCCNRKLVPFEIKL